MKVIRPPYKKPTLFVFTKQSNGDYTVYVNPSYLTEWRSTHLGTAPSSIDTKEEIEAKTKLARLERLSYELVYKALKSRLRKLSTENKLALLKREWEGCWLGQVAIPSQVEKDFMNEFSDKKIILPE